MSVLFAAAALAPSRADALEIIIHWDDPSIEGSMFDVDGPAGMDAALTARASVRAVADRMEQLITTPLLGFESDPATGNEVTCWGFNDGEPLSVEADTIHLRITMTTGSSGAGAESCSVSGTDEFKELVWYRGAPPNDQGVRPDIGAYNEIQVSDLVVVDGVWHIDHTTPVVPETRSLFGTVAHEMMHLFATHSGVWWGGADDVPSAFGQLTDDGFFVGEQSMIHNAEGISEYEPMPVQILTGPHVGPTTASFRVEDGSPRRPVSNPNGQSGTDQERPADITALDIALLHDTGWSIDWSAVSRPYCEEPRFYAWLERYHDGDDEMYTPMLDAYVLPWAQPYADGPWDFDGDEQLLRAPEDDFVDWILFTAWNPDSTLKFRRAAKLRSDGALVGAHGECLFRHGYHSYGGGVASTVQLDHHDHLGVEAPEPLLVGLGSYDDTYDFRFSDVDPQVVAGSGWAMPFDGDVVDGYEGRPCYRTTLTALIPGIWTDGVCQGRRRGGAVDVSPGLPAGGSAD